jgi:L-cysteine:1D-myo-inositol 2-amino-2-deoxy-alpha-D-glucopyranoside ligase
LRRDGVDPAAIRLALLAHHYRADWEWTDQVLQDAVTRLGHWRAAVSRPDGPPAEALVEEIREALANDLDAPAALAAVDRWTVLQEESGGTDTGAPGVVSRAVDALLGVAL